MFRRVVLFVTVGLGISLLTSTASACVLKVSSASAGSQAGSEDVITVQFIQTHRNCSIKPEETIFETKGMKIVSESDWQNVRTGVYECTVKVAYPEKGPAVFKAERICPKGGMTKELNILVQ